MQDRQPIAIWEVLPVGGRLFSVLPPKGGTVVGQVSMILVKKCRLWKTDLPISGLRFLHPLHIVGHVPTTVGHVSIRAVFQQNLLYLPLGSAAATTATVYQGGSYEGLAVDVSVRDAL